MNRSTISIDTRAVAANTRHLRRLHGGDLWAIVKADGYGHGAADVARAALDAGAIGAGVATVAEALALRRALPGARILVLSPVGEVDLADCVGLEIVLSTAEAVEGTRRSAVGAVHVKVDTGMGRWGLDAPEAIAVARTLAEQGRLAGLMSHLATSESLDRSFADAQIRRFAEVSRDVPECPRHLANSGGILYLPEARFGAARCGLALYGISPRDDDARAVGLVPALHWHSTVRSVRVLPDGASTGYGRVFFASGSTRVALIPVGYADGFPRRAAGEAAVLVRGRRCPVVAVAMDQLAAVVPAAVVAGDPVVLIGVDGDERVTLSDLARAAGTIGYEVACGLGPRPTRSERSTVDDP